MKSPGRAGKNDDPGLFKKSYSNDPVPQHRIPILTDYDHTRLGLKHDSVPPGSELKAFRNSIENVSGYHNKTLKLEKSLTSDPFHD